MKLVSLAPDGQLGIVVGDRVVGTADLGWDVPASMADLLTDWDAGIGDLAQALASLDAAAGRPLSEVELLPPVPRPGKVIAVGLNYRSHAQEQDREPPTSPVLFAKFATSLTGHDTEIRWSRRLTQAVDYEAELAVVIGRQCRRVAAAQALDFVAGYSCLNDVSARDLQYSDKQFVRAKSLDTFGPTGPWLVTADEIGDPQALRIACRVNGETRQDASTSDMVFSVAELVAFCSQAFTLEPGDVIASGTPAGVGWFRQPRLMLQHGDVVEIEIERIGVLRNRCVEEDA